MRGTFQLMLWLLVSLPVCVSSASEPTTVGPSDRVVVVPGGRDCGGQLYEHHNGRFASAIAWQGDGIVPPYYGTLAEAFDLGSGVIYCGVYWLTQNGNFNGHVADLYVWDGGIAGPPSTVLHMVTGHLFTNVPHWPEVGQNDVPLQVPVSGAFTIGYWGDWPGEQCGYYVPYNEWVQHGHPWTCIAPGLQYPSGWQHPSVVGGWEAIESLGLGVYFGTPSSVDDHIGERPPLESTTWGALKALTK
jgi:hypothetical protein